MATTKNHHWKLRLSIALLMLILAFVGVIVTDIYQDGAWRYWQIISIVYAVLSLTLSFYLKKMGWSKAIWTLWHELFHWIGLMLAIFIISYFVKTGIMGRFQSGLVVLTLLAFATYLAGIYIEATYIPIGVLLGFFAAGTALFQAYIYSVILPLTIVGALIVGWIVYRSRQIE
ncbi:MAG: hypothetical protein K2P51_08335 [Rhabdochlamydiaceae bacterium]|nr:hypothetical protein [Rhabdochlamydiaceae bacterium]